MSGLTASLSIAVRSLLTHQAAISTTSNNVANANTPGYSRQRPILLQEDPVQFGSLWFGTGVGIDRVSSVRDRVLEFRIDQETQQIGRLDAFLGALAPVEAAFNEMAGGGLESELTAFFNSLQSLSTDPTSVALRQGVIAAGDSLANSFHRLETTLATTTAALNRNIDQVVMEVNDLTPRIADLNRRISALTSTDQEAGALEDERHLLIRQLSELIEVSVIESDSGLTVSTAGGTAMVVGSETIPLTTSIEPMTNRVLVSLGGTDVTPGISEGQLGGLIAARDSTIASATADLDQLAYDLSTAFNAAHQAGFDLNGAPGVDFFGQPGSVAGAARAFGVAITDPDLVAASSDGSPGSNGNLLTLVNLRDQAVVNGQSPADFYTRMLVDIGNEVSQKDGERGLHGLLQRQLENQRSALSGVSLDEEAANLIRFQQGFTAAARVVAVVNELTEIAVNLGRS